MSKCHVFSVDDAVQYGVEKAVILQNIRFWLEKVKANDKDEHKHDGYYWTYNSARAFAEIFPYYNKSKVHRLLTQLEEDGVIVSGNFNKAGYDRTKWYSMPEFSISNNCNTQIADVQNGSSESATPIPYVITDVNPDVISNTISDEKPKAAKKKKHDIPDDFAATEKQVEKCNQYGINVQELIDGFDDFHSSKGNQYVDWSKAFNTWINNHIKFEKLKPINQVNRNEINQSANSQPKQSSADVYAAKLAEQRRQREAANTTATGSDRANVYDMEETF